jgi:hypothetical protein
MLKSKAIELIKSFPKDEYKRFEEFVRSPYFNKSQSLVKLTAALKKFHPAFDSKDFTEEYIYSKVFGKDKYSYGVMRNLMSDFLFLCESFIVNEKLNRELFSNGMNVISLLDEYQKRNLFNLYYFRNKKFSEELEKQKVNSNKFRLLSEFEALQQEYEFNMISYKPDITKGFYRRALYDLCIITNMLYRNSNNVYFSSITAQANPDESIFFRFVKRIDIDDFLQDVKESDPEEKVYIELFLNLIKLVTVCAEESEKYYFKVKQSVYSLLDRFENEYKFSLLNLMRNYCLYHERYKRQEFKDELYTIYRVMLDNVNFFENKFGSHLSSMYEEIIITAIDRNEFEFAAGFMNKYTSLIDKGIRDSMTGYVNAYINFTKGNYEKTLEILSTIKPPNIYNNMRVKFLYLNAYYELGYFEEGFSFLDSFKHYISSDKIPEKSKPVQLELHNIFMRLFRYKNAPEKYSAYDLQKLMKDVKEHNFYFGKSWFIKKTEELNRFITQ